MTDFYIKQNDTRPALQAILKDADGNPINLVGATAVFHMSRRGSLVVSGPCEIPNPATGQVNYIWQAGDTDEIGTYNAEIEVTYSDGGIETHPNGKHWIISIHNELY